MTWTRRMHKRNFFAIVVFQICISVDCLRPVWTSGESKANTPFFCKQSFAEQSPPLQTLHNKLALLVGIVGISVCTLGPSSTFAIAQQYKLPPIDRTDTTRCTLTSSSMGQANAARDKLYDLRECDLTKQSAASKDMSGMIASSADFSGVNFKEAQISKALARNSKFVGCDFTNAIVDRVSFDGSDLRQSVFSNAVLSGTTFTDANLQDTDFSNAYLGPFDVKNLCANPTLTGQNPVTKANTRESAGCD